MCRSDPAFQQPWRDEWKASKHLLQTVLAYSRPCADHCRSTTFFPHNDLVEMFQTVLTHRSRFFLLQVILIFSIIQFKPARYEDYVFPPWAQGVGWVIALASIIWIPLGAVHTLWVLPGSIMQVRLSYSLIFPVSPNKIQPCLHLWSNSPTETEAVHQTVRAEWKVKDAVLWEGRDTWKPSHRCRQHGHESTWKTSYWDNLLIPQCSAQALSVKQVWSELNH